MSRALKRQMLTMVELLEKANQALKVSLTVTCMNENGIRQLLSDCQETAVAMGNELEMIFGEGTDLVHELEGYHENLYQMTLVLKEPEKRYELLKDLIQQINQAKRLLDELISDRLEVVFLPYKASMWDSSMEYLWNASRNDEECDTYVVPIPYYDRGSDGGFTRYHYEGDKMPSHVQVTHYENYDLQKRWPDTVFIQDPFDQMNMDISIDPRFYSHEVKKIADTLVYIAYHSDEPLPVETEYINEAKVHCVCSGILNADMIIVHSEKMKQVYIDILTQNFGESTRKDWEKKIFSIRSSEIEQLQNHKENEEQ